jgi:hypothetical protein
VASTSAPSLTRSGALRDGGGSNDSCDAVFVYDLNARWAEKPAHDSGARATVQAQLWYCDTDNPCKGAMAPIHDHAVRRARVDGPPLIWVDLSTPWGGSR